MEPLSFNKIARIASYTTFWGWNITFLVLALFGVMPWLSLAVTTAVLAGEMPLNFLISLWLLILVPIISVWLAFKKFRGQPQLQIRWFYGVEAPIFLLCLLRLFLFRELTLASLFLVGSVVLAAFIYSHYLIQAALSKPTNGKIVLSLHSLLLVIAVYAGALLSFYALPVGWSLIKFILQLEWLKVLFDIIMTPDIWLPVLLGILWWTPFALLFLFFSIALFVFLPIALTRYYGQAWQQAAQQASLPYAWGISTTVITAWLGIFIWVVQQPQGEIFTRLSQPTDTPTQKHQLLDDAESIRQGLLNAYLYRYRYLSAQVEVNHIAQLYKNVFGLPTAITEPLQTAYNILLSPLLYQGTSDDDTKAAEHYAALFDIPIQKGEAAAITAALEATSDRDQVEAGLLNINQQQVWLAEQQITTVPSGPVTQVELYEVYENHTPEQQEIFYYFALPENAAVTGLWLGESPDRNQRQTFTVSPRGAAQKVYRAQVRERVDPALLEQVGPRQYRLRAFPIPPRQLPPRLNRLFGRSTQQSTEEPDRMYLWLTYTVLNESQKAILPKLLEKRNVYWTNATKRFINGTENSHRHAWMPPLFTDKVTASGNLTTELAINNAVYTVSVQAIPAELAKQLHDEPQKLAVLVDTSYSMHRQPEPIQQALNWAAQQSADVFIQPVHEPLRKLTEPQQKVSALTFFGVLSVSDLWNQAATLQAQWSYHAVFVLTDTGSYELTPDKPTLLEAQAPIWLVHLDKLAPAYEDKIMHQLLSSHGGIATNINAAYQQFLIQKNVAASQRIHGKYLWDFAVTPAVMNEDSKSSLNNPIAAKLLIDYLASQPTDLTLEVLDTIHQIAKTYSVITPYSSMIVLVNNQQREQLQQAEKEENRFDRTVDSGVETLSRPENLMVSAVPEPETWVLILIAFLLLYGLVKRRVQMLPSQTG
jgi:putative PEP-CTERM system integral membrane protein